MMVYMKKYTFLRSIFLLIGLLANFFSFADYQELQKWLLEHPEFVDGKFYYINENTNKQISGERYKYAKWQYYGNS